MRFLYAFIAAWSWACIIILCSTKAGLTISNDLAILTTAIVIAGALAGGGDK